MVSPRGLAHTWIISSKELIFRSRAYIDAKPEPRRAFKVTCAIQFSKSMKTCASSLREKADGESSRGQKRSQTEFLWGLFPAAKAR